MESWVYKQGEEKGIEKGRAEGLQAARRALVLLYEARLGPLPEHLRARVQAATTPDLISRWCELVASGSKEEVDAALVRD